MKFSDDDEDLENLLSSEVVIVGDNASKFGSRTGTETGPEAEAEAETKADKTSASASMHSAEKVLIESEKNENGNDGKNATNSVNGNHDDHGDDEKGGVELNVPTKTQDDKGAAAAVSSINDNSGVDSIFKVNSNTPKGNQNGAGGGGSTCTSTQNSGSGGGGGPSEISNINSVRSDATDCESLVTINIDRSHTNSFAEDGVVFMGWNRSTSTSTNASTDAVQVSDKTNFNSYSNPNGSSADNSKGAGGNANMTKSPNNRLVAGARNKLNFTGTPNQNSNLSSSPSSSSSTTPTTQKQSQTQPKKNRWQEMLGSNVRWRTPQNRSIRKGIEGGSGSASSNSSANQVQMIHKRQVVSKNSAVHKNEGGGMNVSVITEDRNSLRGDNNSKNNKNNDENDSSSPPSLLEEQTTPTARGDNNSTNAMNDNEEDVICNEAAVDKELDVQVEVRTETMAGGTGGGGGCQDLKIDTNCVTTTVTGGEETKTQRPLSPPSLGFNSNYDSSAVTLSFTTTASPSKHNQQRKKPFGRNSKNMKIKSRKVKPSEQSKNIMNDDVMMQKEFVQIKPFYAYPEGFQMSNSELYQEMMRKSSNVETLKSTSLLFSEEEDGGNKNMSNPNQIGSLKVEVLSCTGLPAFRRNKPNSIAYLVCGDCVFATDVINSSHSPMWPARSRRAATFPLFHAYARLYAGIFSITDKDNDDYAGRSVVDIATLRPNISYDVSLPLRASAIVYDRQPRGVVRLRFCLSWNNDRAAILSYIPKKLDEVFVNNEEQADLVTIPCADPKSLRNVAFTIHGEDLPGKYSKKAFRAINREMNLYKFQTPVVFQRTLLNLMAYEKPLASAYIFIGWMAILYYRVYHLVPSYLMSLLIVVHLNNYHDLISKEKVHAIFEPLSLHEIFNALVHGSMIDEPLGYSLQQCSDNDNYMSNVSAVELPVDDHIEFPFSESKYKRLPLKYYLCPKALNKKRNISNGNDSIDDSSCNTADRDSGESDNDSNSDRDEKSDEKADLSKMIPSGPEQDDLVETKENTFQENLKQIENVLHSLTGDLFHEQISRSIPRSNEPLDNTDKGIPGLQVNKFTNPLAVLSAAFLEPVMNVINVYLLAVRSIFNLTNWRDPYLSFWILVVMMSLMVLFALFPWRSFFFCTGLILFGPQNLMLKKLSLFDAIFGDIEVAQLDEDIGDGQLNATNKKRRRFKRNRSGKPEPRNIAQCEYKSRPLFSTQHGLRQIKRKNGKNTEPLEIVVPYARTRRDRFYCWPPYSLLSQEKTPHDDLNNNSMHKKFQ